MVQFSGLITQFVLDRVSGLHVSESSTGHFNDAAGGGVPLWTENWTGSNAVQVSDGLFNVILGSLTQIPLDVITTHDTPHLGATVGTDDEMAPE